MRILNSFMHSLTLSVFIVVIEKSWSTDINITENLLRLSLLQNPNNGEHYQSQTGANYPNLPSTVFLNNQKQVDERISNIIAENVLHFGHNLGLELAALDPFSSKSEIFSPLSIISALSLLMLGAKGKSYHELKQLLALDSDNELIYHPNKYHEELSLMLNDLQHLNLNSVGVNRRPNANWRLTKLKTAPVRSTGRTQPAADHIIKIANGLFVQNGYTLNPDYSQVIKSMYESDLTQLDFLSRNREARDYINAWVNKATFGKIPYIISGDVEKSTNVIMASALYFKGFWETSFFPRATTEDYFYPDGVHNPPIKVQMMPTGGVFPFYDAKEYNCRIIGLPYKGNETTMYVIQPYNSTRRRLRDLQHVLNARKINEMIDNMERKTAVLVFPKMHFTRSMTLKYILQTMNVHNIFLNGFSDLSLIGYRPSTSYSGTTVQLSPEVTTVSFDSIQRKMPIYQKSQIYDRFDEPALIFSSRFGEIEETNDSGNTKIDNETKTTTTEMTTKNETSSFTIAPKPSNKKEKRQLSHLYRDIVREALFRLEANRLRIDAYRGDLFVDDILHKVDFAVDEQGTEAAAATLTYLHRSGTDVVFRGDTPFLTIIRHDPTKLPLFYGIINKPEL